MAAATGLITFEEFAAMPEDGYLYELRNGELFRMPPPLHKHYRIQLELRDLLAAAAGSSGKVGTELGFRTAEGHEYRLPDVAFLSRERWKNIPDDGWLVGSPELVVEVLSPSNSKAEIADKQKLCMANGCREFWVVDGKRRTVRVSTADGGSTTYKCGERIPLMFGGDLAVDAIFESE